MDPIKLNIFRELSEVLISRNVSYSSDIRKIRIIHVSWLGQGVGGNTSITVWACGVRL